MSTVGDRADDEHTTAHGAAPTRSAGRRSCNAAESHREDRHHPHKAARKSPRNTTRCAVVAGTREQARAAAQAHWALQLTGAGTTDRQRRRRRPKAQLALCSGRRGSTRKRNAADGSNPAPRDAACRRSSVALTPWRDTRRAKTTVTCHCSGGGRAEME